MSACFRSFSINLFTLYPGLVPAVQARLDLDVGIAPQGCEAGAFAALGKWGIWGHDLTVQ